MSKIIYKLARKSVGPCKGCSSLLCSRSGPNPLLLELTEIEPVNKEILSKCRKGYQDCYNCTRYDCGDNTNSIIFENEKEKCPNKLHLCRNGTY